MIPPNTVYLDVETTGLSPSDEIIEIGILSEDGRVLLDTRVRPVNHTVWQEAQEINGISPEDVIKSPIFEEIRTQVIESIANKKVVIYNADFDSMFLQKELKHAKRVECCMDAFAPVYGDWHDYFCSYTWKSLATAARYVYYSWEGAKHSAIADCKATRAVWRYLEDDTEKKRVDDIRRQKKEDQEIEWQVEDYLTAIKVEERKYWRELSERRSKQWHLMIVGIPILLSFGQKREDLDEMYHRMFTGCSKDIWNKLWRYENLPVFRERKNIPKNLVVFSKLDTVKWVLETIIPVAYYLSKSGKSFSLLYNPSDISKIRKTKPNRYESFQDVPKYLKSKTRLKKEDRVDVDKEGIKSVAEYRLNGYSGVEYIPLYEVKGVKPNG